MHCRSFKSVVFLLLLLLLSHCKSRFIALWSTLLSCFGIRMLQSYRNIAKFLEVCGLDKFLTVWAFYSSTVCKLHAVIKATCECNTGVQLYIKLK